MSNPKWTREEMFLAADIAGDRGWRGVNRSNRKVIELSELLRSADLHEDALKESSFRNPNSVAMKVNNLVASHPQSLGKGLRSSVAERRVVEEFLRDPREMKRVAEGIRTQLGRRAPNQQQSGS